jgi:high-affinity Fe2+/Pb2+ permease
MRIVPRFPAKMLATAAICAVLAAAGWGIAGGAGITCALVVTMLIAAWRHDNDLGTCFSIATLLTIVIVFLVVLVGLLGMLALNR